MYIYILCRAYCPPNGSTNEPSESNFCKGKRMQNICALWYKPLHALSIAVPYVTMFLFIRSFDYFKGFLQTREQV